MKKRWRKEMLIETYTKEELRNETYVTPQLMIDDLLSYVSDWVVDYIMQHSHFT
ncbi:MAG: hypothetical protein U0N77_04780 [Turicibacter sanguinis]|uniref:hypothetical protein n=1 Tax=Turicibacter sanguinis TaxID=154288 RepID=UPI002F958DAA